MPDDTVKKRLGELLFSEVPCLVALLDREQRLVLTNPTFDKLFGPGEGLYCYQAYKGREEPCDPCPLHEVFSDGEPRSCRQQGVDADGREVSYDLRALPVPDDDGAVRYVVQLARDVTRLVELEQGLDQAERLAAVGLTVAGMAHTIKNILAGLEGGIYVVDSGLKKEDQGRIQGGWEMVKGYVEQVTALVKNLLRYSRAEETERGELSPADLARDVAELYQSKASMSGVALEVEVEDEVKETRIVADEAGMHAALTNLVANALDACVWDPEPADQPRIVVRVARGKPGRLLLSVADNGMGIAEENQRKILRAFFTTKGIRGTGLGLLLTKKTAEEHGGTISFRSTPGEGSTFTIELPVAEHAPEA